MSVQISSNRLVETYSLVTKSVQSRESKVEGTSKGALEKDEEDGKEGRVRKREQGVSFHLGKKNWTYFYLCENLELLWELTAC